LGNQTGNSQFSFYEFCYYGSTYYAMYVSTVGIALVAETEGCLLGE